MTGLQQLAASHAAAERVTAQWARSFHFASSFLPREKLYDYCRHADNLVDLRGDRPAELVRGDLTALGAMVRAVHAGDVPDDARWLALWDTFRRYPVPRAPLLALLDGVATDHYCTQVAGGVGLMLGPVLGAVEEGFRDCGVGLGVAMQLTNVLRDVSEDLAEDRVYLPADELAAYGITHEMLLARRMTPALRRFIAYQVLRARYYFGLGDAVIDLFPADGSRLTVRLMQRTYAGILDQLERRQHDLFRGRAYVSRTRKRFILERTLLSDGPIAVAQLALPSV